MKVLFISALTPYPLYSGGQVRTFNLLSRLSKHHEITLVTFLRNPSEVQYEKQLPFVKKIITQYRGHAWQPGYVVGSLMGSKPLLLTSYDHPQLRAAIARELASDSYDLIHIEPWYVWPSVPEVTIPVIAATHNIEHEVYMQFAKSVRWSLLRPGYYWDVWKLRCWEQEVWKRAARVIAVSDDDARTIATSVGPERVRIVPNGVDTKAYRPVIRKRVGSPVFLFVGSFMWMQNRDAVSWLLSSIWPELRRRHPGSILRIIGRNMPEGLRRLTTGGHIELMEQVEDVADEFHRADMLLAPIRIGGGTSFKILEAMASGLPVVTTSLGATGMHVTSGEEVRIANTSQEFTDAVAYLVKNPGEYIRMARQARALIEREYNWDAISSVLDRVWYETAKQHH
ncbi:glycosyltransferase [Candidatus Gottesmanbacteria bacterium]|nr:glycosyltransferase [Candidatus Gottesmanbacteria bacterium]